MKKLIIIALCSITMIGCEQKPKYRGSADPNLNLPPNPHGGRYRVGNLGGKPVLLGEGISFVEYEDSPILNLENRRKDYEPPLRNFDSVITSFGAKLKYTTGLLYVGYGGAPKGSEVARLAKESKRQMEAEWNTVDHQWLNIGVNAGRRYPKSANTADRIFMNSTLDAENFNKEHKEGVHYLNVYIPANVKEYELEKYDPHPEWVKHWDIDDTKDMYVYRGQNGKVTTLIQCENLPSTNLAYMCDMRWSFEPEMRVWFDVSFQRVHLKDWRLMQEKTEQLIKSLVVNPEQLKQRAKPINN